MRSSRALLGRLLQLGLLSLLPWACSHAQRIQTQLLVNAEVRELLPLQDGSVAADFRADYLNGNAVQVGGRYLRLMRDGRIDPDWPLNDIGRVSVLIADPADGSLLVGGSFDSLRGPQGNEPRARIARISADGRLLPWTLQPATGESALSDVTAIVSLTDGGLVFVDDTEGDGFRLCMAAANAGEFRCPQRIAGSPARLQAQADGSVLVEGTRLKLGASEESVLLRLQPGTLDWDASFVFDSSLFPYSRFVAVQGNTVWAAKPGRLYRLAANGGVDAEDSLAVSSDFQGFHVNDSGQLLILENGYYPETNRGRIVVSRILAGDTPSRDPTWPKVEWPGWAHVLASRGDRLYLGGSVGSRSLGVAGILELSAIDGTVRPDTLPVRLGLVAHFGPHSAVSTPDGGAVFTGRFSQSVAGFAPGILKVDAEGHPVPGWGEWPEGDYLTAAAGEDGFIYVATTQGGSSPTHLRRVRLEDGKLDPSWSLFMGELEPWAMAVHEGELWFAFSRDFAWDRMGVGRVSTSMPPQFDPSWTTQPFAPGWPTRIFPGADQSALVHSIYGGEDVGFDPPPPQPTPTFRHLHRFLLGGTEVSRVPAGPQDSTASRIEDVEPMADGSLFIIRYENGGYHLKRFLANGTWDPDFTPELGEIELGRTIALDEARGKLYFTGYGSTFSGNCVMRLDLVAQTVDTDWPGEGAEVCGPYLELSIRGDRVFAAPARFETDGFDPLGGFLSVKVRPLFVDGFEGE